MGYTHYWERPEELDKAKFAAFAADVRKLYTAAAEIGVKLASVDGTKKPVATVARVHFNGSSSCGHTSSQSVSAQFPVYAEGNALGPALRLSGKFEHYVCQGDCAYESVVIDRSTKQSRHAQDKPLVFEFCKTGRSHYDIAVTAVLIAFKHHFGDDVRVSSDGDDDEWHDARLMCSMTLGYGDDFHFVTAADGERHLRRVAAAAKEDAA